jgi:hypothetical protein
VRRFGTASLRHRGAFGNLLLHRQPRPFSFTLSFKPEISSYRTYNSQIVGPHLWRDSWREMVGCLRRRGRKAAAFVGSHAEPGSDNCKRPGSVEAATAETTGRPGRSLSITASRRGMEAKSCP